MRFTCGPCLACSGLELEAGMKAKENGHYQSASEHSETIFPEGMGQRDSMDGTGHVCMFVQLSTTHHVRTNTRKV